MSVKPARLMVAMIAVIAAPAFAQNVATVNGKPIPQAKVDQLVKQVVAQGKGTDSPQLRQDIKESLIGREVMLQEADKQGIGARPDIKSQIDNVRQMIIIRAMLSDYVKKHPVTDAEIKAEYDKFKAQYGDKDYHARHILVDNEADAKAIIAKLKGGAKFEDLAKQMSKDGSAANGGDLDWQNPSQLFPEFSKVMVTLQKGQITETPVQSRAGWHVIKVEDIRPAKVPTLEELKPQISEALTQRKVAAYQEELRKKAKVQ